MLRLVATRIAMLVPLLFVVSLTTFLLSALLKQDPAQLILGDNVSESAREAVRAQLGLNRSVFVQYFSWAGKALRGDLGRSYYSSVSVSDSVSQRLGVTVALTAVALILALIVGLTAGIVSALNRGSWIDRAVTFLTSFGNAMPPFWLGLVLVSVFAIGLSWFPATGYVPLSQGFGPWLNSVILPAIALSVGAASVFARQTRSSMIGVLDENYIRTAVSTGVRSRVVVLKYALKNAFVPLLSVMSFQVTAMLGGALVVEKVFGIPGLGDLAITAVLKHDVPMIQGIVLVTAVIVLLINLLLDIGYMEAVAFLWG